jgi:hypothetical protein
MSFLPRHMKVITIGAACAACAAAGAGASAIATAGAAGTSTGTGSTAGAAGTSTAASPSAHTANVRRALARRAVQGDLIVATKSGFATVTFSRGFVQSVSGNQLTIREGTKKATYKTVTLSIPSSAKVRDNGQTASLSQLTQGQRVGVLQGPERTLVVARTPRH